MTIRSGNSPMETTVPNGPIAARTDLLTANGAAPAARRQALDRLTSALRTSVDAASLAAFRIAFGLTAAYWAFDDLRSGRVTELYVAPKFHFSYWPFTWVEPWPGIGPYVHVLALGFLGICIAAGVAYRWTTLVFAVGLTIFFLWDRTNYQNHYYLLALISWTLVFLPLNRTAAIDAVNRPESASDVVPTWALWLVRFHIALPYVFGGIAKWNRDWLAGAALRDYLVTKTSVPWIGPLLGTPDAAIAMAWAGLILDLSIVPLLLWRGTRIPAYLAALAFHLCNHFLFSIHIFPWFMIATTTVFFEPGWPRRLLRLPPIAIPAGDCRWRMAPLRFRLGFGLVAAYVGLQLALPFRHLAYGGDAGWHERGHLFAWRMMLRTKRAVLRIYMTDTTAGETWNADLREYLSQEQLMKCPYDPEMVLDLAHQLRDDYTARTGRTPEVRALVLVCYNGRKPQLFLDPTVDLAREPRGAFPRGWVMAPREPLPAEPWRRPVREWQAAVALPPLPRVTRGPHGEQLAADADPVESEPATTVFPPIPATRQWPLAGLKAFPSPTGQVRPQPRVAP